MAAIGHAVTQVTTNQTKSTTGYGDVTGATIDSSNFVAGDSYLIWVNAQIAVTTAVASVGVKTVHGSTDFAGSEYIFTPAVVSMYYTYTWFTVWTAVATENVKLQFQTLAAGDPVNLDQITLTAIHLSELQATDWYFAEDHTAITLSVTATDGAGVTFTPINNNDDWLVLTSARFNVATIGTDFISRISESVGATTLPSFQRGGGSVTNHFLQTNARVFTLSNAAHTVKEQSLLTGTGAAGDQRSDSFVLCLRLNAFNNHANVYTEPLLGSLSTTNYATNVQTVNYTPTVTGDALIFSTWLSDMNSATVTCKGRQQIDGVDSPATQTTDAYTQNRANVSTDRNPMQYLTLISQNTTTHTINADGSNSTSNSTRGARYRTIVVFSMELPAVAATVRPEQLAYLQAVNRGAIR